MNSLPAELLIQIFDFIDKKSLQNLAQVSVRLSKLIDSDYYWTHRLKLNYSYRGSTVKLAYYHLETQKDKILALLSYPHYLCEPTNLVNATSLPLQLSRTSLGYRLQVDISFKQADSFYYPDFIPKIHKDKIFFFKRPKDVDFYDYEKTIIKRLIFERTLTNDNFKILDRNEARELIGSYARQGYLYYGGAELNQDEVHHLKMLGLVQLPNDN